MALTKFDIASAALVAIGAEPVASFDSAGSAEEIACFHLYQPAVDHYLSIHPWRFATRTTQMPRDAAEPPTGWLASYTAPSDMKALQAIRINRWEIDRPFDRFENHIFVNASETDAVYAVHTYEPPIAWWPGYFVELVQTGLAARFAFAIAGKLDLQDGLNKAAEYQLRVARNADSRQQTTRRFKVDGRRSIMQARRS